MVYVGVTLELYCVTRWDVASRAQKRGFGSTSKQWPVRKVDVVRCVSVSLACGGIVARYRGLGSSRRGE